MCATTKNTMLKHYHVPSATKSKKGIFSIKATVIWKGTIDEVGMPNMKSLSLTVQKL